MSHFDFIRRRPLICLSIISALVLLGSVTPAAAGELRWKLKAGDVLHYQMVQDTQVRMVQAGRTGKTTITQTIDMTWKITAVDDAGLATLVQTIDRMRLKGLTPEGSIEADSRDNKLSPALAASLGPMFKALIGAQFKMKMSPSGRISAVEVPAAAIEAAKGQPGLASTFNPESLKEMTTQSTIPLPEGPIEPGQTWSDNKNVGGVAIEMRNTYKGPVEVDGRSLEKIDTQAEILIDLPQMEGYKSELEKGELKGEVFFDSAAGRMTGSKIKQDIVLAISGQGQSLRQEIQSLVELKLIVPGKAAKPAAADEGNGQGATAPMPE